MSISAFGPPGCCLRGENPNLQFKLADLAPEDPIALPGGCEVHPGVVRPFLIEALRPCKDDIGEP